MPRKLFSEDGDEYEVPTDEEIAELKEKAGKAEEMQTDMEEKEKELKKLRDKEMNFSALRKKSSEELEKMQEGWSEKEKSLFGDIEKLNEKIETYHTATLSSYEESVISELAGDDEDLKTKLKETAKEFVGSPITKEDIFSRYKRAYTLVKGESPKVNPINQFVPTSRTDIPTSKKKGYTDTEDGKKNFAGWFPDSKVAKDLKKKEE